MTKNPDQIKFQFILDQLASPLFIPTQHGIYVSKTAKGSVDFGKDTISRRISAIDKIIRLDDPIGYEALASVSTLADSGYYGESKKGFRSVGSRSAKALGLKWNRRQERYCINEITETKLKNLGGNIFEGLVLAATKPKLPQLPFSDKVYPWEGCLRSRSMELMSALGGSRSISPGVIKLMLLNESRPLNGKDAAIELLKILLDPLTPQKITEEIKDCLSGHFPMWGFVEEFLLEQVKNEFEGSPFKETDAEKKTAIRSYYEKYPFLIKAVASYLLMILLAAPVYADQTILEKISSNDLYNRGFQVASSVKTSDKTGLHPYVETNKNHSSVGFKYTSNNFKEFLWGLSRPLHIYNTNPRTKKKEILPFYNPLKAFKEGAIVGFLNPRAWKRNPALTAGTFIIEAGIAAAVASSGGSSGGGSSSGGGGASAGGGGSSGGGSGMGGS